MYVYLLFFLMLSWTFFSHHSVFPGGVLHYQFLSMKHFVANRDVGIRFLVFVGRFNSIFQSQGKFCILIFVQ